MSDEMVIGSWSPYRIPTSFEFARARGNVGLRGGLGLTGAIPSPDFPGEQVASQPVASMAEWHSSPSVQSNMSYSALILGKLGGRCRQSGVKLVGSLDKRPCPFISGVIVPLMDSPSVGYEMSI